MGHQPLGRKWVRRISRVTGLDVVWASGNGGGYRMSMRMVRHRTYRRALDRAAAAEAEVKRMHTWANQVRDATHRQICAYRAGSEQVLADLRTVRRQLLDAHLCADCEAKARLAVDSLGPLIDQAGGMLTG